MKQLFDLLLKAYALRATRRELYALSDHMLRDIGVRRDEIASVTASSGDIAAPAPRAASARPD